MSSHGLTFPRVLLLRVIASRGRSSSTELATVLRVTTANLPGLLDRLEADGYVTRTRDAKDRRILCVEATASGRRKLKALWRAGMRELTKEFGSWTDHDLLVLRDLLTRLAASDLGPIRGPQLVPIRAAPARGRRST